MSVYTTKSGETRDPSAPLTDYEKYLLEKLFSDPGQLPQRFKAWLTDYVSTNGSLHVSNMPTLKGEEWREVGGTGNPAFLGTWVNYGAGHETAAFYKDPLGRVHLKGLIKFGTISTTAFTLPEGYRPFSTLIFACISHDGVNYQHGRLDVSAAGLIVPIAGGTEFFSINVSFRAA